MSNSFKLTPAMENVIAELEIHRKKIASSKIQGWGAIALGIVTLLSLFAAGKDIMALVIGAAAILPGIVILYRIRDDINKYRYRFKQEVVGAALNTIKHDISFDHDNGISESEFISSHLFATQPDRYHSEDLITGKDEKTSFYFSEVHAEYKTETQTKSGRQVHWHDILKGIFFLLILIRTLMGLPLYVPRT